MEFYLELACNLYYFYIIMLVVGFKEYDSGEMNICQLSAIILKI